jgi:hypothetical protein
VERGQRLDPRWKEANREKEEDEAGRNAAGGEFYFEVLRTNRKTA